MKKLTLIAQNPQGLVLTWPEHEFANRYRLEYLTDTFDYLLVKYLEQNSVFVPRESLREYNPYRVHYIYVDEDSGQEFSIETTELLYHQKLEPITLVSLKSYEGGTLSFYSDTHFDLYRVYNIIDKPQLLVETEDCQITGCVIKEGEIYQVEGYKKDESGNLILSALSDPYICQFYSRNQVVNPQLSVIVPVYNCEAFLSRTVDSILSSSFQELEVILVNDGSRDKSGIICDWYQDNYSNVRVIHKENKGVCSARNCGMDHANGEFIAFVDNDDLVHPYMYKKLYDAVIENGTDIAIAQTIMRTDIKQSELVLDPLEITEIVSNHKYEEMMAAKGTHKNIYWVAVWNKIVRLSVARKVRFLDDIPYYEDTAYTASLYTYIDQFTMVKGAYYIWDKRKQKTVGTSTNQYQLLESELHWRYYLLTILAPLFQGNMSNSIVADICSLDIIKHLLEEYGKYTFAPSIKAMFNGMLKYYVRENSIPIEQFKNSQNDQLEKLYHVWQEIRDSDAIEYDGFGELPKPSDILGLKAF